jgi:hypothetical protein
VTGITTYAAAAVLSWTTGQVQTPALSNAQIGLFTTVGADDGTGFVEVSGNSYARAPTTAQSWGTPSGKPTQIVNITSIAYPVSSGPWGTILGFGLFDANQNMLWFDYLGNFQWQPFTAAVGAVGALGVFNVPGHGFAAGDQIVLTGEYGGRLPQATTSIAGVLTVGNVTVDSFTVGANITVAGSGTLRKVLPIVIALNQTAAFNPAALVMQLA